MKAKSEDCTDLKKIVGPCARHLVQDCIRQKLQNCDDAKASAEACTKNSIAQFLSRKPGCFLRLKDACKKEQKNNPKKPETKIPKGCTSWFDGCNLCKVTTAGAKGACTRKFCRKPDAPFCQKFDDGRVCARSRASKKSVCKKPGSSPPAKPVVKRPTCEDVTTDLDLSDKEVCKKVFYLCEDKPVLTADCKVKKEQEEKEECGKLKDNAKEKKKKAKCCVDGKLSDDACKGFRGPNKLPEDCKTRCFDNGKFKNVKDCVPCRGKGNLRPTKDDKKDDKDKDDKDKPDEKAAKIPFDPARVKESIKQIASALNKVCRHTHTHAH